MERVEVHLPQGSYAIKIGPKLLGQLGDDLKQLGFKNKAIIITHPVINNIYSKSFEAGLRNAGLNPCFIEVPAGEEHKSLQEAGKLYTQLSDLQAERLTPILALGGGVIGDLGGFVAATYMRGVPLIQIPTSLLAQVDSSIGGKVAVNHEKLKNNIGAFYQPQLVISDVSTLKTLPVTELENGLAEVIKYGIIQDRELFQLIENNLPLIKSVDESLIEEVVFRCARIKADVVEKDEKDIGLRQILNFGHTVGHGIETASEFGIQHGRAVAIGMVAAAMIAHKMNMLSSSELNRIKSVIKKAGLPTVLPPLDIKNIKLAMQHDKKRIEGKMQFVLPRSIGEVFITDAVSNALVESVLKELYEEAQDLRYDRRQ